MASITINTRADLDSTFGTTEYQDFIVRLRGSMTRIEDQRVYPDGYNEPEYNGPETTPLWVEVEDLTTIELFGFKKSEF
jgi:hypothetical protein